MSDPLAELKRRAYARPEDDGSAAAAQAELAQFAEEQRRAERGVEIDLPELPEFGVVGVRSQALLGVAAVVVTIAAIASFQPRAESLDVFDRAQTADDLLSMSVGLDDIDPTTVRHLASQPDIDVFGSLTTGDGICLTAEYDPDEGSSGTSCTSLADFRRTGLEVQLFRGAYLEGVLISVHWGPNGEPEITAP